MQHHFHIAIGGEAIAFLLQFVAQLFVIIDLSVADHPDLLIICEIGLMTMRQVNDAQAPETETGIPVNKSVGFIWTAMPDGIRHGR